MNFNQLPPRTIKQTNQIMTFYRISDIPVSEHNENKLFFIKQLNNYYRYNPDNEHFEVAIVVPDYGEQMLEKQDLLITSDSIDIQDNVITVKENILNTINNNTSKISELQNTKQDKLKTIKKLDTTERFFEEDEHENIIIPSKYCTFEITTNNIIKKILGLSFMLYDEVDPENTALIFELEKTTDNNFYLKCDGNYLYTAHPSGYPTHFSPEEKTELCFKKSSNYINDYSVILAPKDNATGRLSSLEEIESYNSSFYPALNLYYPILFTKFYSYDEELELLEIVDNKINNNLLGTNDNNIILNENTIAINTNPSFNNVQILNMDNDSNSATNKIYVDTAITTNVSTKADTTYVDNSLLNKADITYVDNSLLNKADTTYVDNSLLNKADITYVDNSLLNKADITYVNSAISSINGSTIDISMNPSINTINTNKVNVEAITRTFIKTKDVNTNIVMGEIDMNDNNININSNAVNITDGGSSYYPKPGNLNIIGNCAKGKPGYIYNQGHNAIGGTVLIKCNGAQGGETGSNSGFRKSGAGGNIMLLSTAGLDAKWNGTNPTTEQQGRINIYTQSVLTTAEGTGIINIGKTDGSILRIENNKIYMFNKEITSEMIDKIIALP